MQLGVLCAARREACAEITIRELEGRGGAHVVDSRTLFYSAADAAAAPSLPAGWKLVRRPGPRGGGVDFRWMVGQLDPTMDAILFEDDVQPCRNAVAAMVAIPVPDGCGAVSYYDAGDTIGSLYAGHTTGLHIVPASGPSNLGFHGAQALRLPAWLITRMQAGEFDPPHTGQDVWIGQLLSGLGLNIGVTCPSYVQHVGDDSLCSPGATLSGVRAPASNFPGEDFDALGELPVTITAGPATPRPRVTWCGLHGAHHDNAIACPAV